MYPSFVKTVTAARKKFQSIIYQGMTDFATEIFFNKTSPIEGLLCIFF